MAVEQQLRQKTILNNVRATVEHGATFFGLSLLLDSVASTQPELKMLMAAGGIASLSAGEILRLYKGGELRNLLNTYAQEGPDEALNSYYEKRKGSLRCWTNIIVDATLVASASLGIQGINAHNFTETALSLPMAYGAIRGAYHAINSAGHALGAALLALKITAPSKPDQEISKIRADTFEVGG